jgi:hypothetical protein
MSWSPPQVSSGAPLPDPPPAAPPRRHTKTRLIIAIGAVAAVAAALFVATRHGNNSTQAAGGTGNGQTATIGPDGGRMLIPKTDPNGAGISLAVPKGALSEDVGMAIAASRGRVGKLLALADEQPDVWSGLADYTLDNQDTLLHPVFGPLVLASFTEFTGPTITFGPSGLQLDQPATVEVPLSLVELPTGTVPVVLLEGDNGWEVVGGVTVDDAKGVLRFEVTHFSRSRIGRILRNMVANPTASPTIEQYHQALETLSAGPAEGATDGVMRAILCGQGNTFNAAAIPDASTTLDYLGFETVRISRAPAGAETRIRDTLRAHFEASRAANNRTPHDVTFDSLLQMAMNETGGDPFQALVLAHDVLRDNRNSPSIQGVMANVRGDGGDENGARYHLLGTAVYAFAYEHLRATHQTGMFWPPRAETVVSWEEAWVSGDIRTDTVEYAVDRLGARLGRDLYREYAAIAAGHRSVYAELLCATVPTTTTTSTTTTVEESTTTSSSTTSTVEETTTSAPPEAATSTVPPDIVLGTGDVQATLIWSGDSDMDLHVVEPNGEETYFSSPSSSTGASLDHDDIPGCGANTGDHVENIFWPQGAAPHGEYRAYVNFYHACTDGGTQSVQLTVRVNGQVVVSQAVTLTGSGATSDLFLFTV